MGMPFLSRDLAIPVDDKDALFEKCASELRVSIDYYRSHKLKADITKVIICGDKFFDGLDKFTAEELKIATEAVDTPPGLREGEKLPPSAIVSAGLALGGLGRSNYSVNFSPLAVVIKKKKTVNILFLEAIAAVFIILLVFQVMASKVKTLTSQLNAVIDSGKALPAETEDVDKDTLKNFKENGIEELGFLQFISNSRVPWTAKLDRMTKLIPKGVWLDNLSTKEEFASPGSRYPSRIKRTITITGSAFSSDGSDEMEHINSFYTALKSDKVFMDGIRNIELGSIEKKEFEGYWVSLFVISASSD
jgi:Tfp pilus assembly protein PilN